MKLVLTQSHIPLDSLSLTDYSIYSTCSLLRLLPLNFLCSKLSTCVQLSYRSDHLRALSSPKTAVGHSEFMRWGFEKKSSVPVQWWSVLTCLWVCPCVHRKANVLVSILVDMALGFLLMYWLYSDNHISMLANALVPAADVSGIFIFCDLRPWESTQTCLHSFSSVTPTQKKNKLETWLKVFVTLVT